MNSICIRPGTPNDDNREYLPEAIVGSDMVVNESGNNSQPYPERLKEYHEILCGGYEGTWYEYVPSTYRPGRKTPVVFSMHGGLMTGWGQCVYTSWSLVAEREGLIVVFPNGHKGRLWGMVKMYGRKAPPAVAGIPIPADTETPEDNYDLCFVLRLIERIKEKYNVDEQRIFMQGMSNGSGITQQFAQYYGNILAGACISAGAHRMPLYTDGSGNLANRGGPLDIWLACPENNGLYAENLPSNAKAAKEARYYWKTINHVEGMPEISIVGGDNFAFFKAGNAGLTFHDVKNRDHGQAFDEACICWDYMFSGSRREGELVVHGGTHCKRRGDAFAAAFTEGADRVWWHNRCQALPAAPVKWQMLKYHGLEGESITRGEYLMVPLAFLADMVGAEYHADDDGLSVWLELPDGRCLQFARGCIGCVIDDSVRAMFCEAIFRSGQLMIGVEWFAQYVMNLHVSVCNKVVYVTDHFAQLSYFMADMIRDLLTENFDRDTFVPDALAAWEEEPHGF